MVKAARPPAALSRAGVPAATGDLAVNGEPDLSPAQRVAVARLGRLLWQISETRANRNAHLVGGGASDDGDHGSATSDRGGRPVSPRGMR
jgi:hypothetical protein